MLTRRKTSWPPRRPELKIDGGDALITAFARAIVHDKSGDGGNDGSDRICRNIEPFLLLYSVNVLTLYAQGFYSFFSACANGQKNSP